MPNASDVDVEEGMGSPITDRSFRCFTVLLLAESNVGSPAKIVALKRDLRSFLTKPTLPRYTSHVSHVHPWSKNPL